MKKSLIIVMIFGLFTAHQAICLNGDPDLPDFSKMTKEEKTAYHQKKHEEMMAEIQARQEAIKREQLKYQGIASALKKILQSHEFKTDLHDTLKNLLSKYASKLTPDQKAQMQEIIASLQAMPMGPQTSPVPLEKVQQGMEKIEPFLNEVASQFGTFEEKGQAAIEYAKQILQAFKEALETK